MIANILLWLGAASAIVALAFFHYDYERAGRNWTAANLVLLWLYFICK